MTDARRKQKKFRGDLQPMRVRPLLELKEIQARCGGNAVLAAMIGAVNAEEYLRLERSNEH
jgi:hypothetical protein